MKNKLILAICSTVLVGTFVGIENNISYNKMKEELNKIIEIKENSNSELQEENRDLNTLINQKEEENVQLNKTIEELNIKLKEQNAYIEDFKKKDKVILDRGINFSNKIKVNCIITYYTNTEDTLQGGKKDKKGKPLTSHNEPVCALPKDIPYGSYLLLDESVNGSNIYKNVDTGGAIKWINEDTLKVDVFVPNVDYNYIINHYNNKKISGYIYLK